MCFLLDINILKRMFIMSYLTVNVCMKYGVGLYVKSCEDNLIFCFV
jgi:hypothetical protein